jgi:cell division protein FtsQ
MKNEQQPRRKWVRPVAYMLGATALLGVLGFVEATNGNTVCTELVIEVDGRTDMHFIDDDAVREQVNAAATVTGMALAEIPIAAIEQRLCAVPCVSEADAYHTLDGRLHVRVHQREPIVRVIDSDGRSFYIDAEGWTMPVSADWTARVPVAVGSVREPRTSTGVRNVLVNDSTSGASRAALVYNAAMTLRKDPFWNAMMDQIAVGADGTMQLIPRVGPRRVLIGHGEDLPLRLAKLKVFYDQALVNNDWRRYDRIDLRFTDQVIATQRNTSPSPTN